MLPTTPLYEKAPNSCRFKLQIASKIITYISIWNEIFKIVLHGSL